jgi:hypothetical protein
VLSRQGVIDAGGVTGAGSSPADCDVVFFIDADGGFVVGLVVLSGGIGLSSLGTFVSAGTGAPVVCVVDGISLDGATAPVPAQAAVSAQMPNKEVSFFIFVSP